MHRRNKGTGQLSISHRAGRVSHGDTETLRNSDKGTIQIKGQVIYQVAKLVDLVNLAAISRA